MKRYQVVGGVGGALAILGAFLPWITVRSGIFTMSVAGTDAGGDGLVTAGLGAAVVFALLVGKATGWSVAAAVAGALCAGTAIYDYQKATGRADEDVMVSPGVGLALTVLGGVLMFATPFLRDSDEMPPTPLPPPTLP
jgi:hypothetical protein